MRDDARREIPRWLAVRTRPGRRGSVRRCAVRSSFSFLLLFTPPLLKKGSLTAWRSRCNSATEQACFPRPLVATLFCPAVCPVLRPMDVCLLRFVRDLFDISSFFVFSITIHNSTEFGIFALSFHSS